MTGKDLYESLTDIDNEIIAEANNENNSNTVSKKVKKFPYKGLIVAAAFLIVSLYGLFYQSTINQGSNTDNPNSTTTAPIEVSNVFSIVAYASESEEDFLSANYINDTRPTTLKANVKTMLASYSPLMSSVPGFPFTVDFTDEENGNVTVDVDNGNINLWDKETFVISKLDKETSIVSGTTFYWSPLNMENNITENAIITITIKVDENTTETQSIKITSEDYLYYATVIED